MRKLMSKKQGGFTLIELMIVVAILGILAAIAIPAFVTYVRRAKTVEATENLSKLFDAVSSYYSRETVGSGIDATMSSHCFIGKLDNGITPNAQKQAGTYTLGWVTIGFQLPPGYYNFKVNEGTGVAGCSQPADKKDFGTLQAIGDLDGDTTKSTFEYAIATSKENELYHATGFYIVNETE